MEKTTKFYPGQKVMCVDGNGEVGMVKGKIYTIKKLQSKHAHLEFYEIEGAVGGHGYVHIRFIPYFQHLFEEDV